MKSKEWNKLIKDAKEKGQELKRLVKEKYITPDEWPNVLGIASKLKPPEPIFTPNSIVPNKSKSVEFIHPPTYSGYPLFKEEMGQSADKGYSSPPSSVIKVRGRILNNVEGGYAVGVAGIVAFLPSPLDLEVLFNQKSSRSALPGFGSVNGLDQSPPTRRGTSSRSAMIDRENLFDFYVVSAGHDNQGRPDIILSCVPPQGKSFSSPIASSMGTKTVYDRETVMDNLKAMRARIV
jgi:hypothetical protein